MTRPGGGAGIVAAVRLEARRGARPRAPLTVPVLLAALLLAGCGGTDPAADRREQVAALTEAANAGDADRLRERAGRLIDTVARQSAAQDLGTDEAQRLTALAEAVRAKADLIDTELIEQRRREQEREAAAKAERQRLEAERLRLEAERQKLEQERQKAEQERQKDEQEDEEERGKGKGKDDD